MEQQNPSKLEQKASEETDPDAWRVAATRTFFGLFEYAGIVTGVSAFTLASNYRERILGGIFGAVVFAYGRYCSSLIDNSTINKENSLEREVEKKN